MAGRMQRIFSPINPTTRTIELVIRGLGEEPERSFQWIL